MPKSKRAKVFNLTQVAKKTRENKDKLFANIRECIPQYQYCFVFSVDNMRNNYLKDVRRELSDSRCVSSALPSHTQLPKRKMNKTKVLTPPPTTASSSARQNSPPAPSAAPPKTPKPTACTS